MGFPPSSGPGEVVLGVPDRITEASDLTKKFIGLIDQHVMAGFWDLNELAQRKGVDQFAPGGRGEQMTFASPDEKGRAADLPGIWAGAGRQPEPSTVEFVSKASVGLFAN